MNNDTTDVNSSNLMNGSQKTDGLKNKRGKQNVALQSIFKKMEENKQVILIKNLMCNYNLYRLFKEDDVTTNFKIFLINIIMY